MPASLFDIVSGSFANGQEVFDTPRGAHLILSIISNMERLFNTRRGSIAHMPDYGLPDITEVYRDIPDSIGKLQSAITTAIQLYEPRLRRVRVIHQDTNKDSMRLEFILHAELQNREKVRFQTTFSSVDPARVCRWTRQD